MGVSGEEVDPKYKTLIIRAGNEHHVLEDDFTITGTALIDGTHCVLKGFAGELPKHFRQDMKKLLAGYGVETAEWQIDVENTVKGRDKT